jgi:cysteine desulfurase
LGAACAIAKTEITTNAQNIGALRDYLEKALLQIEDTTVNGSTSQRLYNVTNIQFQGVDSDAMIMGLSNPEDDMPLIAVSNGSACTSASIEPSHVLTAMGLDELQAFSSIRFSLGKFNTQQEIEIVISNINRIVYTLRAMVI